MNNDKKTIIIDELSLKDAIKYRDQLDLTVERYEKAYEQETDITKKDLWDQKAEAAFQQANRIQERIEKLELEAKASRKESLQRLKIFGLSALTVAVLVGGAYKLGESVKENLTVTGNEPTQAQPINNIEEVNVLSESEEILLAKTQRIENLLAEYNLNHGNNAELIQSYLSNQTFTDLNDYDQAIESLSSLLIHSYRNKDARVLDLVVENQPTGESKLELEATKQFITPYITNPSEINAIRWGVGAKRAMNDGLTTDYRTLDGTAAHEVQMLVFEMVWPVITENLQNDLVYDENKLPQELVSNSRLAINGPVYVRIDKVAESLNEEYPFAVNGRITAMVNDCNEVRTR